MKKIALTVMLLFLILFTLTAQGVEIRQSEKTIFI